MDDLDKAPVAYLMVPDARALRDLAGLWRRWLRGEIAHGETAWRDVFALLRDLRPWGPQDRVQPLDAATLLTEIEPLGEFENVRLREIELVFRAASGTGAGSERTRRVLSRYREGASSREHASTISPITRF